MAGMSEPASSDLYQIPEWSLGWRLKRALDHGGVSAQEMAAELGVHPGTVSRWMNDRERPRLIYIRAWAHKCKVPPAWLAEGKEDDAPAVGIEPTPADVHYPATRRLSEIEKSLVKKELRGLIRRGTFNPNGPPITPDLPIASAG